MLRGIALLVLILAAITLGIRIYLDQALIRHVSMVMTEAAPSETREQLIVAETTPVQESEAAEASVDQIAQFESAFAEIRALEDIAAVEQQGSALKEDYTTIAKLWNRELEALGRAITANMTESEKDARHHQVGGEGTSGPGDRRTQLGPREDPPPQHLGPGVRNAAGGARAPRKLL